MVSGGIYWKTGKLQAGQVNQAAVSAARHGTAQNKAEPHHGACSRSAAPGLCGLRWLPLLAAPKARRQEHACTARAGACEPLS